MVPCRQSWAVAFLLALPPLGCGRAVPLSHAVDGDVEPDAGPSVASLPPCDEGRWDCTGGLCRLVGGSRGLPPAGADWTCEQAVIIGDDGVWCCGCPGQWVCHGRLTRDLLLGTEPCGWHCTLDGDYRRAPDQVHCTRELTDHDTPPGAAPYPRCHCERRLDGGGVPCARCEKSSQLGTVCRVDRD